MARTVLPVAPKAIGAFEILISLVTERSTSDSFRLLDEEVQPHQDRDDC
jgi:hypothetical protein